MRPPLIDGVQERRHRPVACVQRVVQFLGCQSILVDKTVTATVALRRTFNGSGDGSTDIKEYVSIACRQTNCKVDGFRCQHMTQLVAGRQLLSNIGGTRKRKYVTNTHRALVATVTYIISVTLYSMHYFHTT